MAAILEWNDAFLDPGMSGEMDPENRKEVWISRIVCREPINDTRLIYNDPRCPRFFTILGQDNTMFVVNRELAQVRDAPQCYDLKVTYANRYQNSQNADKPEIQFQFIIDPTLRPALIVGSSYTVREALPLALQGITSPGILTPAYAQSDSEGYKTPVITTAGEPLILEEEYHRRRFTLTKNVKLLSPLMVNGGDYINAKDTIVAGIKYPAMTLWLWPIEFGHLCVENGFPYFPITITILHNPRTWLRRVRNAGYYMKDVNAKFKEVQVSVPGGGLFGLQNQTVSRLKKYYPMVPIRFSQGKIKPDRPVLLRQDGRPLQMVITGSYPDPAGLDDNGNVVVPGVPLPVPPGGVNAGFAFFPQVRRLYTYDVLSPEDFGRSFTKEELQETEIKFRTFPYLDFEKELPFLYDNGDSGIVDTILE